MDIFDNKFKSILNKNQDLVPDEFSWENMKDGINSKLDKPDRIQIKSGIGISSYLLPALLLSSIAVIIFLILIVPEINKSTDSILQSIAKNNLKNISENKDYFDSDEINTQGNKPVEQDEKSFRSIINNKTEEDNLQINFVKEEASITSKNITNQKSFSKAISQVNHSSEIIIQDDLFVETEKSEQKIIQSNMLNMSLGYAFEAENIEGINTKKINIGKLYSKIITIENKDIYFDISSASIKPFTFKKKSRIPLSFEMGGGINYYFVDYKGDESLAMRKNETRTSLIGQNVSGSLSIGLNNKSYLSFGADYMSMNERFNFSGHKQIQVLVEQVIVRIDSNMITREVSYFKKDTLVNAIENRRIVHYNNVKSINFAINYAYNWTLSEYWYMSTQIGLSYNMTNYSAGRTIGLNESIIHFGKTNEIYSNSQIGIIGGIGAYYKLNKNISLGSKITVNKYVSNWSNEIDLIAKPSILSYQLGLKYNL